MQSQIVKKTILAFCIAAIHAFSWQVTQVTPASPNAVIYDAYAQNDSPAISYDLSSSFLSDWPVWLTMHMSGYFAENNSTIDPGLTIQGGSQNNYLSNPNNWAFYHNGLSWHLPLSHAPQPWLTPSFSWIGISVIDPNVFFPLQNGSLWVDSHRGNTNNEKSLVFFYDGEGTQHYDFWLSQVHNPMGFALWFKHDIAQGHRDDTDGHDSNLLLQFSTQTSSRTDHWSLQWYDSHANFNQTIPLELYRVSPDAFYVSPNIIDQSAYRGQWQRQQLITDDKIYHLSVDAKIQHQDGQFTHPLNVSSNCSDFSGGELCLSDQAIVTSANTTITASDVGSPRSYALDSQSHNDSQSFQVNQHIEIDHDDAHRFFGLDFHFVDTDYEENNFLAQLSQTRVASDVTNGGSTVKLGGQKSTSAANSALSNLSPVDATQKEMDLVLYGLERWHYKPQTAIDFKASFHNTYYDAKDHRDNTNFTGASVTSDHHFYRLNPSIGITHQLNQKSFVFGNLYQANLPPSPQALACSNASNPCYWPSGFFQAGELSQTVDTGLRLGYEFTNWHIIDGLSWGVSGMWQHHNNDIIMVPTDWMQGYLKNVDQTQRLSTNVHTHWMHDKWRLDSNYQYQNAYYASSFSVAKAYDSGNQQVSSGDPMPGLPKHQLRFNLGYQITPNVALKGNWLLVGSTEYYGNFTGDKSSQESGQWQLTDLPGYGIVGASLTWRPTHQLTMQLNVSNLLDKTYFTSGTFGSAPDAAYVPMSELGDTGSGAVQGIDDPRFVMPGEARLWTLMLKLAF